MTEEIWKPVVGFKGAYEVSNLGKVRSLPRMVRVSRYGGQRFAPGKTLQPGLSSNGSQTVCLQSEGKKRSRPIHDFVLEAFVGPKVGRQACRHLDGDRLNNALTNLRWGSYGENREDLFLHDRGRVSRATIAAIKAAKGIQREIAEQHGVTQAFVSLVKLGKQRANG